MTVASKILLRRCATCDVHYEHNDGGTCLSCGRIFCSRHLYGRIAYFFRFLRPPRPICGECRKEARTRS
jgi:hypothetical protein